MIVRFFMIFAAAILAVLLLKAVAAVALVAVVAFGALFAFNVARRAVLGSGTRRRVGTRRPGGSVPLPLRRVKPLAHPTVSVRR